MPDMDTRTSNGKPTVPPKPKWLRGKSVEAACRKQTQSDAWSSSDDSPPATLAADNTLPSLKGTLKSKFMSVIRNKHRLKVKTSHVLSPLAANYVTSKSAASRPVFDSSSSAITCNVLGSKSSSAIAALSRSTSLDMKRTTTWHSTYRELMTYGSSPTISESPEEWSAEESGGDSSDYMRTLSLPADYKQDASVASQDSPHMACGHVNGLPREQQDLNSNVVSGGVLKI